MSFVTRVSDTHTYRYDSSEINFFPSENEGLAVTMDTPRLHLTPVVNTPEECERYAQLLGDKTVMEKFGTGEVWSKEKVQYCIENGWAARWQYSPYSAFDIYKQEEDDLVGTIVATPLEPGEMEMGYALHQRYWNMKYASEAATTLVRGFAPAAVEEGYTLKGKALEIITATARPDNPYSARILKKVGMHFVKQEVKYNSLRNFYSIALSDLLPKKA